MSRADRIFTPLLAGASWRDRLVSTLGALIGIALTALICSRLSGVPEAWPLLVAPMGASTVLLFAVPTSPLAQPWPVFGGNVISTVVAVAVVQSMGHGWFAAGVAVAAAILAMSVLRCLHPPGGACALLPVLGGSAVAAQGYGFALVPVALNSFVLVAVAYLFHRFSGHSYPHRARPAPPAGIGAEDIDAALAELGEPFDVSREDLAALVAAAERHARARK